MAALSLLRVGLALLWTALLAVPTLPLMLLLLPWRKARVIVGASYARAVSFGALPLFGIRPVYEDLRAIRGAYPAILLANHASNADPFLAIWHCPIGAVGVAKKQIAAIPFFGQAYWLSGHLLIDRADAPGARSALAETAAMIERNGMGLYIWPEGTMPKDGRILPFKKGFVHFAIATGLPVVPLVIHDAHLAWPARSLMVRGGTVRVEMLDPIDTRGWTTEDAGRIAEEVRQLYIDRLGEHQRPQV